MPKNQKLCNYCKNHPEPGKDPVLEKHHRPCTTYNNPEHLKECKACERNHRKTENVRKWRANKINKRPVDVAIKNIVAELMKDDAIYEMVNTQKVDQVEFLNSDEVVEMNSDDYIIEEDLGFMEAESPSTELPEQDRKDSGFTLIVQHPMFPKASLSVDDAIRFQSQIENLIDDLRENDQMPKFVSQNLENGCWRVAAADEFTQNWFKEKASEFTCLIGNSNIPVKLIPSSEFPSVICGCFIPGKVIDTAKILTRFHKQNSGLDTSRWDIQEVEQHEKQFLISFALDPVSLSTIRENNCVLNFGMNQVQFFLCENGEDKIEEIDEVYDEIIEI